MNINNLTMFLATGAFAFAASAMPAAAVTVGSYDSGNCYPFSCNDSGTSVGQSIDYQEMYLGTAVGSITIHSLTFYSWPGGNTPSLLGGTYDITLGTTTEPMGSGYPIALSNVATFDDLTISSAQPITSSLTFNGAPYTFDPSSGNLVMEVVVTNQDNVPNGSGNGYLWADYTGSVVSRAYDITNVGVGGGTGALVTTFNSVPEPSTWAMMLFGFAGLGFAGYRTSRKSVSIAV